VASSLGLPAIGFDINPVMVIVAKARLLPFSETPSLAPLALAILEESRRCIYTTNGDPLLIWFKPKTAATLRSLERACNKILVGSDDNWNVNSISSLASTFYTALFKVCRTLVSSLRTANPTWTRLPKDNKERVGFSAKEIEDQFLSAISLICRAAGSEMSRPPQVACRVKLADATTETPAELVDVVLTSPPYCTRIDYAVSTRVELALISRLAEVDVGQLRRRMIGTTVVPDAEIDIRNEWGETCRKFLNDVYRHPSKASKGYYSSTHKDYFNKISLSLKGLANSLKKGGPAFVIVQDSFYKDIYNDLPKIVTEMARSQNLALRHRNDFVSSTCMSRVNSRALAHKMRKGSTEAVLCFVKE